jgi:hypothetical protein
MKQDKELTEQELRERLAFLREGLSRLHRDLARTLEEAERKSKHREAELRRLGLLR